MNAKDPSLSFQPCIGWDAALEQKVSKGSFLREISLTSRPLTRRHRVLKVLACRESAEGQTRTRTGATATGGEVFEQVCLAIDIDCNRFSLNTCMLPTHRHHPTINEASVHMLQAKSQQVQSAA